VSKSLKIPTNHVMIVWLVLVIATKAGICPWIAAIDCLVFSLRKEAIVDYYKPPENILLIPYF